MLMIITVVILWLISCVKILREYERAVIFRLGRVLPKPKGPGVIFVFVPFDSSPYPILISIFDIPARRFAFDDLAVRQFHFSLSFENRHKITLPFC